MSAKILSSLTDEDRNLRKQIGCMNGIFQIFDRRHLLSGRRISSHNQTRPLDLLEQKEKPRASVDSSRASNSSPRHSSTSEIQFHRISTKEKQSVVTKNLQSPDLRDVIKDSMYREARSSISPANVEKRSNVVKQQHVDSPRPLRHFKYGKLMGYDESKDEQQMVTFPRYSYDGRETRNASKTTSRLQELPRLSLDSRASSIKLSSSESRSDVFDRLHVEYENCNAEPGNHRRSSSVVAKLMGLESFPEPDSTIENQSKDSTSKPKETFISRSYKPDSGHLQNVSQSPASPSPRLHYVDSFQGSPKMIPQSMKAPTTSSSSRLSSSVYGEIEKRIAELEFKKSGKDLRALKQILEAMQKTRERIENQREVSAEMSTQRRSNSEDSGFDQNLWQSRKINGPSPSKAADRAKFTSSSGIASMDVMYVQRLQTLETKNRKENLTQRCKARALEPRNNSQPESINKKSVVTRRYMEQDRFLKGPQVLKVKTSTNSSFGTSSPRFQQNPFQGEEGTRPNTPSSEPVRIRNHLNKKVVERNSTKDKKHRSKSKTPRFSDIQSNDVSSELTNSSYQGDTASQKSESNFSLASQVEADNAVERQKYVKTRREQISQVQLEEISIEQPSPVSVLDATFYTEDPPSPVRKITLAFQEDEDLSSDETEYQGSDIARPYTSKLQSSMNSVLNVRLSNSDQRITSSNYDASLLSGSTNTDHISKILLASGLIGDVNSIPTACNSSFPSQLISPDMFHALEMEAAKNVKPSSNQKNDTKLIFDTVNEILLRKIMSGGGLYTFAGRNKSNPQDLMKEVCIELNGMSRIQSCDLDDAEDDLMLKLLASDKKYESEDWTSYKSEVPALVLDIERLIFKDLINEVLTNSQQCRQRFTYY